MKLNRADLRKIMYDFNSISNRLLQADYQDYTGVVGKFIAYIKATPIIYDYVLDCGSYDDDMEETFKDIRESYGRKIFALGDTTEEEVCIVFAILNHAVERNVDISFSIAAGYTSSNKYQDRIKSFNDRVVMVLIRHIESYLTKVGIDMGLDEKITYSITISGGQVNIANDNATINATNNAGMDADKIIELINAVKASASDITGPDAETLADSLEVIEEEVKAEKPKKSFIKTAIAALKSIQGTAALATAITDLVEFLQTLF